MTNEYFYALRDFLAEKVCKKIKLRRPQREDDTGFELVTPAVTIGWPETENIEAATVDKIPGIAIGLSAPIVEDGESTTLPIRLVFMVYAPGTLSDAGTLSFDNTGLRDVCNFMDVAVREILDADSIGERLLYDGGGIRWAPDNEQYYDYWLGTVEFTLLAAPLPRIAGAENLS